MSFKKLLAYLNRHKAKLILAFAGLLTAILMLTIGFFRTILIILFTGIGAGYGYLIDRFGFAGANRAIGAFIKQIFKR